MARISAQSFSVVRPIVVVSLLTACHQDFMLHEGKEIWIGDTGVTMDEEGLSVDDTAFSGDDGSDPDDGDGQTGTDGDEGDPDPDPDADESEGIGDDPFGDGSTEEPETEDPPPADDCSETSDLIYVLDKDTAQLSLFDPATNGLTTLGTLDCSSWGTPSSMGVARDGVAYVRYSDQDVFAVDLATLDCTATSYSNSSTGFGSFGMGFATESSTTWRDRLFVANSRQLGLLDPTTWSLTTLGSLPSQAELTGTASGELWGVLPLESPLRVVELDQSSGSVLQTISVATTLNIANLDTFAFAAWDGDFYLFARYYGMGNTTEVYRIERDGSITRVVDELGINVVGAGVSTCAPG